MASSTIQEIIIAAPEFRGAALDLGRCTDLEVLLDGPAGCVAGETRIFNPVAGEHVPIKELCEKRIAPIVQTLMGAIQAEIPFRKGVRDLFRVTLASGRQCVATDNHLFLTPYGWRFLSACAPGSRFLISLPCPLPTTEVLAPLLSLQDALHLSRTPVDSQESYSACCYHDDEQPQWGEDTDLAPVPLLNGALSHSRVGLYGDDQDSSQGRSHLCQQSGPRSKSSYSPLSADRGCIQSHDRQGTSLQACYLCQYDAQFLRETRHLLPIVPLQQHADSMLHHALLSGEFQPYEEHYVYDQMINLTPEQLVAYFLFSGTSQGFSELLLDSYACSLSNFSSNKVLPFDKFNYTAQWDTVSSIEYERTDEYFDLHVPIAEHYLAEGIWHHNTGKTYAALYKEHIILSKYPGCKTLITRKTNTALAGSAIATYRDLIVPEEGVHYFGGNKIRPAAFEYPNGSLLLVNGMDRPEKVKSWEFDRVFVNEATELSIEDWEFCRSRLRHGATPYHQITGDANPGPPTHWLNERCNAGITTRLVSRYEDNPRYWDRFANDWTEAGRDYVLGVLGGLTGVRLARLRYGIWAASEGTVYEDAWNPAKNVVDPFPIPAEWPRELWFDFGYTNPFVCHWVAIDPDGRLYVYREIYKTKTLVEDHAKEIKRLSRWGEKGGDPLPRRLIADHDAEGRATLERHLGLHTTPAIKRVSEGIQAVSSRLRPAGDGRPRLMYFRNLLVERDRSLAEKKLPTSVIEEYDSYVWKQNASGVKDEPVKEYDHGQDCDRYGVSARDLQNSGVTTLPSIWR